MTVATGRGGPGFVMPSLSPFTLRTPRTYQREFLPRIAACGREGTEVERNHLSGVPSAKTWQLAPSAVATIGGSYDGVPNEHNAAF